jgi:hypothetical protein
MGIFTRFYWNFKTGSFIKGEALLAIGYANFSHVTIVLNDHEILPRVAYDLAHVSIS